MSRLSIFPTFYFTPIKLREASTKLQRKYKDGSQLPENLVRNKLPNILVRIRKLQQDNKQIKQYANTLKSLDLNVLASGFPYEGEGEQTIHKIVLILQHRYYDSIGRRFWLHFQDNPKHSMIRKMLMFAFNQDNKTFLSFSNNIRGAYKEVFNRYKNEELLPAIAQKMLVNEKLITEVLRDWKIEKDSIVETELWLYILEYQMNSNRFVNLQGSKVICGKLEHTTLDRYKGIIINYLSAVEAKEYNLELFTQLIHRLADPRENMHRWQGVSEEVIDKVKRKLMEIELYDFFGTDSERFNYWKKYMNHVKSIDYNEEPPIAAMYFDEFVIVEFAETGNAAYFYERSGFSKHLAHKIKRNIAESDLKDQDAYYYIHKLNHSGNWPSRYDVYMERFLNGDLEYRH